MAARIVKINRKTLYRIIKEIRKRRCLWCTDDEYYNNRGRAALAWEEIAELLNLPEALIRAKWKSMRDLLRRELKKCNVNTLDEYTGKWEHMKVMWFLHRPDQVTEKENNVNESGSEKVVKQEGPNRSSSNELESSSDSEESTRPDKQILHVSTEEYKEPLQVKRRRVSEEDYDMMFLKSLAPYFRELDPVRKLRIRNRIQDIILTEICTQQSYSSGR